MLGAIFAAFVGLAAAQCAVYPNTTCAVPSYSTCVETCSLYQSEKACSHAGCSWVVGRVQFCSVADSNITEACTASTTSMSCDALPNCTWATTYCKQEQFCANTNSSASCTSNLDEAACLAEGCESVEYCLQVDMCGLQDSQVDCTTISGCFWYELLTTQGVTQNISKCQSCFRGPDATQNYFSSFQAVAGLTCPTPGQSTITFSVVAAASTGCSGGSPAPMDYQVLCPSSSAPTNAPPTNAPPANGTDAPTPSDTNSTDAPTPFDTNSTVSSAVAVPVTVAALGACALLA